MVTPIGSWGALDNKSTKTLIPSFKYGLVDLVI